MKKSEQSLARISIIFSVHLGILTPKKSFAKNNTNSDLSSGFVLFAYGGLIVFIDAQKTSQKK